MDTTTIHFFLLQICFTIGESKIYHCDSYAPCGCSRNPVATHRILNREIAGMDTWSWATSLKIGRSLCGGAIISDSHILTAAHCVRRARPSDITVYIGSIYIFQGEPRRVSRIYSHPHYYEDRFRRYVLNDIALLKLSISLNMTDKKLAKVCLPSSNLILRDKSYVIAIGWGTSTENDNVVSQSLQQMTLNTINSATHWCRSIAKNMTTQICAGLMPTGKRGKFFNFCSMDQRAQLRLF